MDILIVDNNREMFCLVHFKVGKPTVYLKNNKYRQYKNRKEDLYGNIYLSNRYNESNKWF